jgi:hypothetical protein
LKKITIYFIGFVFVVMVLGNPAFIFAAEETATMMCDEGVVNLGDTDVNVRDKCGEPNSQSMDEWVYDFGPSQSFKVIFKRGKVVRILESH